MHQANRCSCPISLMNSRGFYFVTSERTYRVITEATDGWPNKDFMNDHFSCISSVSWILLISSCIFMLWYIYILYICITQVCMKVRYLSSCHPFLSMFDTHMIYFLTAYLILNSHEFFSCLSNILLTSYLAILNAFKKDFAYIFKTTNLFI